MDVLIYGYSLIALIGIAGKFLGYAWAELSIIIGMIILPGAVILKSSEELEI